MQLYFLHEQVNGFNGLVGGLVGDSRGRAAFAAATPLAVVGVAAAGAQELAVLLLVALLTGGSALMNIAKD